MSGKNCEKVQDLHKSVLLVELVESINIFENKKNIIVDCTLGLGGHASKIISKMNSGDIFIGFDADIDNLKLAENIINQANKKNVEIILINSNYLNLKEELKKRNIEEITGIYYDLGISSVHIDDPEKGFSFRLDGPLDMRFDKKSGKTAADIINSYKKEDLFKIFKEYGEEPYSRKISEEIYKARKTGVKFNTTKDLAVFLEQFTKNKKLKTKIFQALRIEVNNELENLKISLRDAIDLLKNNGIIFVISFHSLEDRIVKQIFKKEAKDCICSDLICSCKHKKKIKILTKKPILPTMEELQTNPRSRSAKARSARKI